MKKGLLVGFGVLILIVVVIGAWLAGKYNTLVTMEQDVENAQGQVEVVLQRRFDLIPNLVASVQGVMDQETKVFGDLADARTKYAGASSGTPEKLEAAGEYESAISRLLVIMENYPELKSADNMTGLMDELAGTENRIAVERKRFNDSVTAFNKYAKVFPNVFIANLFGFDEKDQFEAVEGSEVAPEVSFDSDEG